MYALVVHHSNSPISTSRLEDPRVLLVARPVHFHPVTLGRQATNAIEEAVPRSLKSSQDSVQVSSEASLISFMIHTSSPQP